MSLITKIIRSFAIAIIISALAYVLFLYYFGLGFDPFAAILFVAISLLIITTIIEFVAITLEQVIARK